MTKLTFNMRFFICLTVIFPVIDFLNGFFLSTGIPIPIGILYRTFFLFFLVGSILVKKLPKEIFILITVLFLLGNILLFLFQSILYQNSLSMIKADVAVYMKYFLWLLIPFYLCQRKDEITAEVYPQIFIIISLFFTIGLLVPYFLGVGNQTYDASDAGYKGYFFANNDTSFAFIISITFTGWQLLQRLKGRWDKKVLFLLFLYSGNLLSLLLVGTKTGILYGGLITFILAILLLFRVSFTTIRKKIGLWIVCICVVPWGLIRGMPFVVEMVSGTYNRIVYFYYLYDGNLLRLLTSSRSDFLQGSWHYFTTAPHPFFTLLFGSGFEYRIVNYGRLGLIEMDLFDAFFSLGLLGILLLLVPLGYFSWLAVQKKIRSIYSIAFFIAIVYSFFAGHVLFSALSSMLLGLICGGIILKREKEDF
ncbi:O-antigen ligase family protein [Listeria ilorinensis]|uniref:O-antigen ligase family protein n=1 Tax=Listeria ilorinensis TaxID=2867439 RepID=UPI001EF6777B|nr:O-antigen ligase family protein [Listeria ilorinensis]